MSAQNLGLSITGLSRGGPNSDFIIEEDSIGFRYEVKLFWLTFDKSVFRRSNIKINVRWHNVHIERRRLRTHERLVSIQGAKGS